MRTMGLDLGTKTCGVALSDPMGIIARPVVTLRFASDDYADALKQVLALIKPNDVTYIVLGFPKHMNNDIGISGQYCLRFKELLEAETDVPILMWDERLTTAAAQRILIMADVSRKKRKQVIDQMAAVQILQGYLDSRSRY